MQQIEKMSFFLRKPAFAPSICGPGGTIGRLRGARGGGGRRAREPTGRAAGGERHVLREQGREDPGGGRWGRGNARLGGSSGALLLPRLRVGVCHETIALAGAGAVWSQRQPQATEAVARKNASKRHAEAAIRSTGIPSLNSAGERGKVQRESARGAEYHPMVARFSHLFVLP